MSVRERLFTVSGYTSLEVLQKFLDELTEACEQGKTKKDFMDTMNDFLERNGYEGLNPFNADVIFRTNMQIKLIMQVIIKSMTNPTTKKIETLLEIYHSRRWRGQRITCTDGRKDISSR